MPANTGLISVIPVHLQRLSRLRTVFNITREGKSEIIYFWYKMDEKMSKPEIVLIFDEECPVCRHYCRKVSIKENPGELKIINARIESDVIREITSRGLDMDQGMVLKSGNEFYSGGEALHRLALISSRTGLFNRLNYWIFKSRAISAWLYPVLVFLRNVLLKSLGKTKINNLRKIGNNNQEVG